MFLWLNDVFLAFRDLTLISKNKLIVSTNETKCLQYKNFKKFQCQIQFPLTFLSRLVSKYFIKFGAPIREFPGDVQPGDERTQRPRL